MSDRQVWVWEAQVGVYGHDALLNEIYSRDDVMKGITSGTPIIMSDGWWKDSRFTHVVVEKRSEVWRGMSDTIGTYFYERIGNDEAILHVNILPEYQRPSLTTPAGKALYKYLWEDTTITYLMGIIPTHNRAANIYAKRFGWAIDLTSPTVRDGIPCNTYWHQLSEKDYE